MTMIRSFTHLLKSSNITHSKKASLLELMAYQLSSSNVFAHKCLEHELGLAQMLTTLRRALEDNWYRKNIAFADEVEGLPYREYIK